MNIIYLIVLLYIKNIFSNALNFFSMKSFSKLERHRKILLNILIAHIIKSFIIFKITQ